MPFSSARDHGGIAFPPAINEISPGNYARYREVLAEGLQSCRNNSLLLTRPLSAEDHMLQSMPDVSPAKWHLGHTTWFFETFILAEYDRGYSSFDPAFEHLFNSYYNGIGEPFLRPSRGMLSRPALQQVREYRQYVDRHLEILIHSCDEQLLGSVAPLLVLGINHEQQHQELILTDIKHALFQNPQFPAYAHGPEATVTDARAQWLNVEAGTHNIGYAGEGFCFDNELPSHDVLTGPFRIEDQQVTNGEWLEFMAAGAYQDVLLWLSDGWAWQQENTVSHPLYWLERDGEWMQFTLQGLKRLQPGAPVCHISYYEADAYARWREARLPTEHEWECAAQQHPEAFNPSSDQVAPECREFQSTWQWTGSAYLPYPGYAPPAGAIGEYNGKFMINQMVLRGSSCATVAGHTRISYRNFFHPAARWQFNGLRLAVNV